MFNEDIFKMLTMCLQSCQNLQGNVFISFVAGNQNTVMRLVDICPPDSSMWCPLWAIAGRCISDDMEVRNHTLLHCPRSCWICDESGTYKILVHFTRWGEVNGTRLESLKKTVNVLGGGVTSSFDWPSRSIPPTPSHSAGHVSLLKTLIINH